jgi:hypothetical protein
MSNGLSNGHVPAPAPLGVKGPRRPWPNDLALPGMVLPVLADPWPWDAQGSIGITCVQRKTQHSSAGGCGSGRHRIRAHCRIDSWCFTSESDSCSGIDRSVHSPPILKMTCPSKERTAPSIAATNAWGCHCKQWRAHHLLVHAYVYTNTIRRVCVQQAL